MTEQSTELNGSGEERQSVQGDGPRRAKLIERSNAVVKMRMEGYSLEDIAEYFELTPKQVKDIIAHRERESMRSNFRLHFLELEIRCLRALYAKGIGELARVDEMTYDDFASTQGVGPNAWQLFCAWK